MKEPIVLTRNGTPCAAIVPVEDVEELAAWRRLEDEIDLKACREYDEARSRGDVALIPAAEIRRRLRR